MKRLAGSILVILGILAVLFGFACTPFVQDLMPVTSPFAGNSHTFLRMVPADPVPSPYAAAAVICAGLISIVAGLFLRHRGAV